MERLNCHVKEYAWGKHGKDSEVARLFAAGHEDFVIGKSTPYAELWMGTHPDGPARLSACQTKLSTHIAKNSSSGNLMNNNNDREEIHLPFIMKVMSIRTTLSLQVHPTKEQAVRLHARDPVHYPDEHHKPELAYALTRFELLCGFRPAREILSNIEAFPPLRNLFGEKNCEDLRSLTAKGFDQKSLKSRIALSKMFRRMMDVDSYQLLKLLSSLFTSLDNGVRGALQEETVQVIRKMASDFPGDVGIFSPLFLNHMILQPGQCCYYAAEELHAYLSGECIECVGCSNNTIRAALTNKFIDRTALCEVLNYVMTEPSDYLVSPVKQTIYPHVTEYAPDCRDFQLHRIQVEVTRDGPLLPVLECASITVVVAGDCNLAELDDNGKTLTEPEFKTDKRISLSHVETERLGMVNEVSRSFFSRGDIIFIDAGKRIRVAECLSTLEAFRTFSFENGPDHGKKATLKLQSIQQAPSAFLSKSSRCRDSPFEASSSYFNVESEMDGMI